MKYADSSTLIEAVVIPKQEDRPAWAEFLAWCFDRDLRLYKHTPDGADEPVVHIGFEPAPDTILQPGHYLVLGLYNPGTVTDPDLFDASHSPVLDPETAAQAEAAIKHFGDVIGPLARKIETAMVTPIVSSPSLGWCRHGSRLAMTETLAVDQVVSGNVSDECTDHGRALTCPEHGMVHPPDFVTKRGQCTPDHRTSETEPEVRTKAYPEPDFEPDPF